VLEKSGDNTQALQFYEQACRFSPDSAMVAYKRIRVLVTMQRIQVRCVLRFPLHFPHNSPSSLPSSLDLILMKSYFLQEAITLLEPLVKKAPDEANVHFLLGKCYLKEGKRTEATVCFTNARELNPKLEAGIRKVMESNGEDEEDEDE
jgi:anaphase-promoting complex subunit 3